MKIAIPVFQTKISPRFDSSQNFILLEIENRRVMNREKVPMKNWSSSAKIQQLVDLNVDTVICGGIDLESMQQLSFSGIKVYSWITGEVEDALTCFLDRGLESGIILGAKGRRKGQWRFCAMENHFCNKAQQSFNLSGKGVNIMPKGNGAGPMRKGTSAGKGPGCGKAGKNGQGSGRRKGRGTGRCKAGKTAEGRMDRN